MRARDHSQILLLISMSLCTPPEWGAAVQMVKRSVLFGNGNHFLKYGHALEISSH
jgi:hypothetical protein